MPVIEDAEDEIRMMLSHGPYFEKALVYCLIKYVPGMRLEITREEYEKFMVKYSTTISFHSHVSDDGDTYVAEMESGMAHENERHARRAN
jgi:hypothetical protein